MSALDAPVLHEASDADVDGVLVWQFAEPLLSIASAPVGGGIGRRSWVLNAQVGEQYARTDLDAHLATVARSLGCGGAGVGFLTAADVSGWSAGTDGGVRVYATVGLRVPTWAAAGDEPVAQPVVGTINLVVWVPSRLDDAALVNAVATVTEAKVQALVDASVPGTGTASDAVCVLCPADGPTERFAGPRSAVGAPIARAVHQAVADGTRTWHERNGS
jgi:adenosylcobinamide amidohydrolase